MIARKFVDNSLKGDYQVETKCGIKIISFFTDKKKSYFSLDFHLERYWIITFPNLLHYATVACIGFIFKYTLFTQALEIKNMAFTEK